jgi:8-oxo-dGTP diphosphatase
MHHINNTHAYRIAVLVFIKNDKGEHLLLLRSKAPNIGSWSPIGGKLETATGESPFECAVRETAEETGHVIDVGDLHLFAMIAEKAYEGDAHWLLFLFDCKRPITSQPPAMHEGSFGFFSRASIDSLPLPETDRTALWPIYDRHHAHFVALRADCHPAHPLSIVIEQITPLTASGAPSCSNNS